MAKFDMDTEGPKMSHILVIEDNLNNARLFEVILERKGGYDVTSIESAENLFEIIEEKKTRAIIMDVSLSNTRFQGRDIDGIGLSQMLKADERTKELPILLVTAHAMHGDRENLLTKSGADDYLSKPITDPGLLIEKIQHLLS